MRAHSLASLPTALAAALVLSGAARADLDAPGRTRAPHPDAALETALATATARLDAGDPDGALSALASVTSMIDEGSRHVRFRRALLEGLALGRAGRLAEAAPPLREARRVAGADGRALAPGVELLLGRAEHAAGDCPAALVAFRRAGPSVFGDGDAALAQARCQLTVGARDRGLATLDAALESPGPLDAELRALRVGVLVDAGLPEAARGDVAALAASLSREALVGLAAALPPTLAALSVDAGLARFPDEPAFAALAARLWQARAPRSAARVAERGAALDPGASSDAAELLRATGDVNAARRHNAGVTDGAGRLRQRLALAVDEADWDRALALRPLLERARLLDDDAVAYALAWASHSVGDAAGAEALLAHVDVRSDAWFERATTLRAAIAQAGLCNAKEAQCAR